MPFTWKHLKLEERANTRKEKFIMKISYVIDGRRQNTWNWTFKFFTRFHLKQTIKPKYKVTLKIYLHYLSGQLVGFRCINWCYILQHVLSEWLYVTNRPMTGQDWWYWFHLTLSPLFEYVWPFVRLVLKGLKVIFGKSCKTFWIIF